MKIFITSNTFFGYKNLINDQYSYFYDQIIPFLKKKSSSDDIFVHGGNIFYNKKSINFDILKNVLDIFDKISDIMPIYILKSVNDEISGDILKRIKNVIIIDDYIKIDKLSIVSYNYDISKVEDNSIIIFNDNYLNNDIYKNISNDIKICTYFDDYKIYDDGILNIGSPYQLNKNTKYEKGLLVVDTVKKKYKLLNNNFSPNFVSYNIDNINDLNNVNIKDNDFLEIKINENLLNNKKNINKFNLFVNKYKRIKINYIIDNGINNKDIIYNIDNFNIRNIINNHINDMNLIEEINNVYKIHDLKNNK